MNRKPMIFSLVWFVFPCALQAADHDESVNGDISNDRLTPTALVLNAQDNRVSGSVISGERDYFTVNVPVGKTMSKIIFEQYISQNSRAFLGMQAGPMFSVSPGEAEPSDLLGYVHFGFDFTIGDNLLDDMATAFGAIGFTSPLAAGDYVFWVNQTEPSPTQYRFDLVVDPATLTGDANADGAVNTMDFNILAGNFGQNLSGVANGDFDTDGYVGSTDFNVLAANYGKVQPGNGLAVTVPEPVCVSLPAMTATALLIRRRR